MAISVTLSHDPASVLRMASEFLASDPIRHNMILSLLHARVTHGEPGRYWLATGSGKIVGVVLQSPLTIAATLTPMSPDVVTAMVHAIADSGGMLPGINGEAATAASFAGQWSERCKSAAVPVQEMRIHELGELREVASVPGKLRQAVSHDRDLLVEWVRAFHVEVDAHLSDPGVLVDRWLPAGQCWLWDHGETVSMAVSQRPAEGVVRVSGVYTPREHRNRGYAAACVHGLSKSMRDAGYRCMLYTDLNNPTSNSIYRRIGYSAVAEALRYRFDG